MDDESSTPSTPEDEAGIVIEGAVVNTRAEAAYELKLSGRSLSQIADDLGYRSAHEVAQAIGSQAKQGAEFMTENAKTERLQLELDRLDRLQEKVWPAAMMGDPKSVEAALRITDRRVKLLGFDRIDTASQQHAVLVIGGAEADYVSRLKELTEE